MAPPKKDAFADLFQSATSSNNSSKVTSLPLSERQRLQQSQQQSLSTLGSAHSSYSNLGVLSGQTSRPSTPLQPNKKSLATPANNIQTSYSHSGSASPAMQDDPFAIFYKNNPVSSSQPNMNVVSNEKPVTTPNPQTGSQVPKIGELSLLDDEFTDVFQSPPQATIIQRPASTNPSTNSNQPPDERSASVASGSRRSGNNDRDFIIAELVDIGFPIESANEAIDACGLNLQNCVNYIMNTMSGRSTPSQPRQDNDNVLGARPEGIKFNEISSGLFKGANKLLNISRNTVMRNLEQFNNKERNVPNWMKNQDQYKADAIEKKVGGEDYGTDEDNIDQQEIERIMRLQREKKEERIRERYGSDKGKVLGNGSRSESSREQSESPAPPRPRRPVDARSEGPTPPEPPRPRRHTQPRTESLTPPVKAPRPHREPEISISSPSPVAPAPVREKTPEVDLLGISSSEATTNGKADPISNLRNRAPLNQFDETDYNLSKTKASEAFKSGDYTTALEAYNTCLSKLPPSHELRVIIFSNLGVVYKLSGHLKDSLQVVDSGLELIDEKEIDSSANITSKSVKYWYMKLISTKAEVLELLERYESSLQLYNLLIQRLGTKDKKIMDGRRRVDKIVNPENHIKKPQPQPQRPKTGSSVPTPSATPKPVQQEEEEEVDTLVKDKIDTKIQAWATSKQNNLRAMLTNLDEIIPGKINMKPALRKLSLNDLMLSKQVKIQYMKVISSIHPDKLASQCKGDKETELICNGVFITLNKRWEAFRKEENI